MSEYLGGLAPGNCPECEAPFELVRPGKTQPTCDCKDKCDMCGHMRFHWSPEAGEKASIQGFVCPVCDLDRDPHSPEDLYRD